MLSPVPTDRAGRSPLEYSSLKWEADAGEGDGGVGEGRQWRKEESETGGRKRESSRRVDGAELTNSRARGRAPSGQHQQC